MLSISTTYHRCVATSSLPSTLIPSPPSSKDRCSSIRLSPTINPSLFPSFPPPPFPSFFRIAKLNRTLGTPPPAKTPPSSALALYLSLYPLPPFFVGFPIEFIFSSHPSTPSHTFLSPSQVSLMTSYFLHNMPRCELVFSSLFNDTVALSSSSHVSK